MTTRLLAAVAGFGACLIVAGAAVIYWPLGLVTAGAMGLAFGLLGETK